MGLTAFIGDDFSSPLKNVKSRPAEMTGVAACAMIRAMQIWDQPEPGTYAAIAERLRVALVALGFPTITEFVQDTEGKITNQQWSNWTAVTSPARPGCRALAAPPLRPIPGLDLLR